MKISKNYFGPGSPKNRFLRFFRNFLREKSGIRESRVRRRFGESRVRRRKPGNLEWQKTNREQNEISVARAARDSQNRRFTRDSRIPDCFC